MLLQNPQLAFALLQAQVVMRIVDPEIALVRLEFCEILQHLQTYSTCIFVCVDNHPWLVSGLEKELCRTCNVAHGFVNFSVPCCRKCSTGKPPSSL